MCTYFVFTIYLLSSLIQFSGKGLDHYQEKWSTMKFKNFLWIFTSHKFSSDAIVDLIPTLTTVLNRLDVDLTVINDFSANVQHSSDDIFAFKRSLKEEKLGRNLASLSYEDETYPELKLHIERQFVET